MSIKPYEIRAFISYSHKDKDSYDWVVKILTQLKRDGLVKVWTDRLIPPGGEVDATISEELQKSDLVLLLMSPDFIASNYCYDKELSVALEQHHSNRSRVVPIIVRYCDWKSLPIAKLKVLPDDGEPIRAWADMDKAWLSVTEGIRMTVNDLIKKMPTDPTLSAPKSLRISVKEMFQQFQIDYEKRGGDTSTKAIFGLAALDSELLGIDKGELVLVAGRPDSGAQQLAHHCVIENGVKHQKSVLLFSLQNPTRILTKKLISQFGRISYKYLSSADLEDQEWPRFTSAITLFSKAPISLQDTPGIAIDEVRTQIAAQAKNGKVDLVVIDSLNFIGTGGLRANNKNLREVGIALKMIARELNVPIVTVLSLGRRCDDRSDKRPLLVDLDDWSIMEEAADKIIFCYRHEMYYKRESNADSIEFCVAKNTGGNLCSVTATYDKESGAILDRVDANTTTR